MSFQHLGFSSSEHHPSTHALTAERSVAGLGTRVFGRQTPGGGLCEVFAAGLADSPHGKLEMTQWPHFAGKR